MSLSPSTSRHISRCSSPSEDLEASLSILDLEDVPASPKNKRKAAPHPTAPTAQSKQYMEHSAVFDEIVATTDYKVVERPSLKRQESERCVSPGSSDGALENSNSSKSDIRRHSSFEPLQRRDIFATHQAMKMALEDAFVVSKKSNAVVDKLLEFNLSVDLAASFSGFSEDPSALHYSCPVLSYMHDDEEDSVELLHYKMRQPSLKKVVEEESWESMTEDESGFGEDSDRCEYHITIQPLDDEMKPPRKRRRSRSCRQLIEKLEHESPQQVLQSLGF